MQGARQATEGPGPNGEPPMMQNWARQAIRGVPGGSWFVGSSQQAEKTQSQAIENNESSIPTQASLANTASQNEPSSNQQLQSQSGSWFGTWNWQ